LNPLQDFLCPFQRVLVLTFSVSLRDFCTTIDQIFPVQRRFLEKQILCELCVLCDLCGEVLTFFVFLCDLCGKPAQVFLVPDSDQRLSATISGEKVLIFLRASGPPLWVLVVLFSLCSFVFLCVLCGKSAQVFLMPDSDQRLSATISREKVLIFLRASVAPLWVLVVLTFSVFLCDLCGKSAQVFLWVLTVISSLVVPMWFKITLWLRRILFGLLSRLRLRVELASSVRRCWTRCLGN